MRKFKSTVFFLIWATAIMLPAKNSFSQIVSQKAIGANGCGPCAIVNSLTAAGSGKALGLLPGSLGIEKAQSIIEKYGGADSRKYGALRTKYTKEHGVADVDLHSILNQVLSDAGEAPVQGKLLRRSDGQSERDFVREVHATIVDSIGQGFHPLLSVRALAAELDEAKDKVFFNSKGGHWISIDKIGDISQHGLSLVIEFSDSISGESQTGFVFFNQHRRATVPISFTVDESGKEQWEWISNEQTLEIVAPGMPIGTARAKWQERALIALRYLVYQELTDTDVPKPASTERSD